MEKFLEILGDDFLDGIVEKLCRLVEDGIISVNEAREVLGFKPLARGRNGSEQEALLRPYTIADEAWLPEDG